MERLPEFRPEQFKEATREQWNDAAQGWNEHTPLIRAWLTDASRMMLDLANVGPGLRVLDVAAGAGDQTRDVAMRVGPSGYVLATDLSPGILEFAQANARAAGLTNVDIKVADGENLGLGEASFDAAVCRLGLMFYPDPLKGLREIHHALKPGARLCAMVFSEPQKNPLIGMIVSTALKHAGLPSRDPYQPGGLLSLGKPGLIDELFGRAGFSDVRTTRVPAVFRLPAASDYVRFVRQSGGPILLVLHKLDDAAKDAAWVEMTEKLSVFQTPSGWEGPNELLLTVGTR
jgi:ubiquinone/menaquinone biosynthesis C-methylase UbiE